MPSSRTLTPAALALAVAAMIPAAALAIARNHSGEIEGAPTSYIAFDLDRTGSGKVVHHMAFSGAPYDCVANPSGETEAMKVKGSFDVVAEKIF